MTNPQPPHTPTPQSPRIHLPGAVGALFIASIPMMLFGGFLARVNADRLFDWAIFQTMLGTVVFWVGLALFMVALVLVGVRAIAQQQLDLLLSAARDRQEGQDT